MSNTPTTCQTEFIASWNDWEGAVCCKLEDYERVETELAAATKRLAEIEQAAERYLSKWNEWHRESSHNGKMHTTHPSCMECSIIDAARKSKEGGE